MGKKVYRQNKKINNNKNKNIVSKDQKNVNNEIIQTNEKAEKRINYNKILKLNQKEQIKKIAKIFSEIVKLNNKKEFHTKLVDKYKTLSHLNVIFVNLSNLNWQKISKCDYGKGFYVQTAELKNNKLDSKIINKILSSKHIRINEFNKLEYSFPFVASDNQISNFIKMRKEIIAEQIIKQYKPDVGDSIIVRHLLTSTENNKTYLFLNDFSFYHNKPQVSISLSLVVNGHEKGLKPLARYDTVGHFSKEFLLKHNIPYIADEYTERTIDFELKHKNISKNNYETNIFSEYVSKFEHMHLATNLQDNIFAMAYYLNTTLSLKMPINTSKLSAFETDVYSKFNNDVKQKEEQMLKDAKSLNGVVPVKQIYNFATNYFNIKNSRFTDNIFTLIDNARNSFKNDELPSIETFYKDENVIKKPVVITHNHQPNKKDEEMELTKK